MNLPWFDEQLAALMQRAQVGTLHHAILLSGMAGIGKSQLAQALAHGLLCMQPSDSGACGQCNTCHLLQANTHPDFHSVISEKQIGVDAIREMIGKLNQTAQMRSNKVCIIHAAHTMTESAANALLKTLEEPTDNTFLILLVDEVHRVLPTILSRCEKVNLAVPAAQQAMNWLAAQLPDDTIDSGLLAAYGGAPLIAYEALQEKSSLNYQQFCADIRAVFNGDKTVLAMATDWQENADYAVKWCQLLCQKAYSDSPESSLHQGYLVTIEAVTRLRNPGVNRVLIIANVVQNIVDSFSSSQLQGADFCL